MHILVHDPKMEKIGQVLTTKKLMQDGNILTSSGVSAGMDMTMFFIDKIAGATIVNKVAAYTEYDGQWTNSHADKWA